MKKLFFSLLALGATMSASAQIAAGDYFIQNVETGTFLNGANDWGTKASVTKHGQKMTVAVSGSGYTIDSHISNGGDSHFLAAGNGTYTDGAAAAHTITALGDGIFSIKDTNGKYLINNDGTKVNFAADNADANKAKWRFISMDDVATLMGTAKIESPVDATYYIGDANFSRNNQYYSNWVWAWGSSNNNKNHNKAGNNDNNVVESFHAQFSLTQTITVPNGVYAVTAQGFYRQDGSDNTNLPYFFANDKKANVPLKTGSENSMANASTSFTNGLYTIEPIYVQVTDGTLNIGVSNMNNDGLWVIFDNFEMKYYGDVTLAEVLLAAYVKAYNEAMDAANAVKQEYLSEADKTALSTLITNNTVELATATQEQLEAAAANLNAAVPAYAYKARVGELAAQGNNTDFTSLLVNPSFELGNNSGWTDNSAAGMWTVMTRANDADPKVGTYWLEKYGNAGKIDFKQTVTGLPKGHYRVSVLALDQASKVKLVANESETAIVGGTKKVYTVDVMLDDNSDLTLGLYVAAHQANSWVGFDDFQLTYVSAEFPALPEAVTGKMNADVAAAQTAAIEAYNAEQSVANYNAAAAAITAAQNSKDKYVEFAAALAAQQALIEGTNVYAAEGFEAYQTAWTTNNEKYENNTLTNEDGVVNPTVATGWHASTAYNFLLTPWKLGESACNEFANALYINTWSTEGEGDGSNFLAPFFEYWVADGQNLAANTISTTLDVENGLYEVSALVRASHNADDFKAVNLTVNEGDAVNVADGAQIGSTNRYMNTFTAQGLVKDGKLTIAFDVPAESKISWFCFKNVKYTKVRDLTPEEQIVYATAEEIAALNDAITAAEAKTVGFLEGEYAPYTNAEAIKTLAAAKAIDTENPVAQETVLEATTALTAATWTANTIEMNAVYDGTFASATNDGAPAGWTMSNNTLGGAYHSRAFVGDTRLSEFNETNSGLFLRFDGTNSNRGSMYFYGRAEGYEMPLKANTKYYVSVDFAGWGSTGKPLRLNVTGPEGFTAVGVQANTTVKADTETKDPQNHYIEFTTTVAGNYQINFQTPGADTNTHNVIVSNIVLKTVPPTEVELSNIMVQEMENPWTGDMTTYVVGSDAEGNEFTFIFADGEYAGASLYTVNDEDCDASEGTATLTVTEEGKALEATVTFTDYADFEKTFHVTGLVPYATAIMAVNADAKYGTFVAPFDVTIPAGVTACVVEGVEKDGATLAMTDLAEMGVDYIPAYTPVLLNAEEGLEKTTVKGFTVPREDDEPIKYGLLIGVLKKTEAEDGTYILQNNDGKVGFYLVNNEKAGKQLYVGANRCYLDKSESSVKAFFFDQETAIKAIDALTSGKAEIYDMNGRKLNKMQKGINIVNGVKVLVK